MKYVFKFFKITLFAFNALYFLIAIGFIMSALFLHFNPNQINELIKHDYADQYHKIIYFLLLFGAFLMFVGLFGCIGIISERSWILSIYFALLFTIFAIQFSGAIYLYVLGVDPFKQFQAKILDAIKNKYGESQVHTRALDYMHYKFKCCGWYSPNDWLNSTYIDPKYAFKLNEPMPLNFHTVSPYNSLVPYKIPHSCCVMNYDLTCILMHKFHEVGCDTIFQIYYQRLEIYIAWVMALLNLFQLTLLVLALYLICMVFLQKKRRSSLLFAKKYKAKSEHAIMTNSYL